VAVAEKHHIDEHIPPMLGNLGVVYLNMGYASTASYYFLKSQSYMEKMGKKNENYYVNQINIINAYCSLNQYSKAMKMMRTIDQHYSDKIRYLYFSNLASIHMELNDREMTAMYLDSSHVWLRNNKEYALNQMELELESALHFNFKDRLEKGIVDYLSDKSQKSLTLKCTFNRAYKRINGKFYDGLKEVENWKNELIPTDYINGDIYYGFLADFYSEKQKPENQINALLKQRDVHDLLVKEKLSNQLEDYILSYRNEQIQHQNRLLGLKNESKESQIKRQRILLTVLIILITLALSFSIFLIVSYGRQRKLKQREQELNDLETSLMNKQLEEYKSSLKVLQRLFYKTSLLKKQLDDSFKTLSSIDNPDEMQAAIMRIKADVKVFYQAHQNLLSENMAGELVKSKVDQLSKFFTELNDKELKIIELILEEFSTNEIAVMLEKSTKNIEFSRTNIRKKMNIPTQLDLNSFLQNWQA
jgi:DNA-binding CsgD family transcriptional regulator